MKSNSQLINHKIQQFHRVRGVGLIEVLVSILVLGVGALGVATMQLTGLKYSSGSQGRSQAILLSTDMMDRMRANRNNANDENDYAITAFSGSADLTGTIPDCYALSCTPAQLAAFDRSNFLQQVETLLPFGLARITTDDTGGLRIYEITLQWRNVANRQNRDGATLNDSDEINDFTFKSAL